VPGTRTRISACTERYSTLEITPELGCVESNHGLKLQKLPYCHCTTPQYIVALQGLERQRPTVPTNCSEDSHAIHYTIEPWYPVRDLNSSGSGGEPLPLPHTVVEAAKS
jgi:hypothetical protein